MSSDEEICDNIALINHSEVVLQGEVHEVKSRFKTNTYKLSIPDSKELVPCNSFEIISLEKKNTELNYLIKKEDSITNSELLRCITDNNEIISFAECLPSMNEIFINTVGMSNSK